ncbi:WecB/TagA/CpsF family glycosyltransferase [Tistrella bauzanensis]|uniref:WecB/TagA/CpsF family glycosyltransferase n=1 Tax=Tistrella arctica TaxID=3133430 RepID=A0ABU9YET7_9PROT
MTGRIDFLGLSISDLDCDPAAAAVAARDPQAPFAYVVTPNAQHMVRIAGGAPDFERAYDGAWLVLSDGNVVRRLSALILNRPLPHASGADVTARLFKAHIQPDDPIMIVGGDDRLVGDLRRRFGVGHVHLHVPPMGFIRDPAAVADAVAVVRASPARYVFIAVGSPQSELLARMIADAGGATGTGLCIGSSLLFVTGRVRRAPTLIRKLGLEGGWRLMLSPVGHFRRVFKESLPIVWIILRARFGGRGIRPSRAGDGGTRGR